MIANDDSIVSSERSDGLLRKCQQEKTYLAGPVTGKKNQNRFAFEKEAKRLRAAGYRVLVPIEFILPNDSWKRAMIICIGQLIHCKRIVFLHGSIWSRGARREWIIAKLLGIPTYREGRL